MSLSSWSKVLATCLIIWVSAVAAFAQGAAKGGHDYDTTKEIKLKGTVSEVRETPSQSDPVFVVVTLADKTTTVVQLAPHDYLKEIDCWLKVGDVVEVTGAKVANATNQVIAREVVFGNYTMVLRVAVNATSGQFERAEK